MNEKNKYLAKNTLIFAIGNLGSKLIVFFLVPLYTAVFTPAEYGAVDIITTVSILAVPIFTLNICESVMRFALDAEADYDEITKIGLFVFILGSIAALVLIPLCNKSWILSKYSFLFYLYVITSALSHILLCDLRGKELLSLYSLGNVFNVLIIALFNIYFLLFLKMGINGYLGAYIIGNSLTSIYAIAVGKGYRVLFNKGINQELLKKMLKFSVVLIPNSFMWWIMDSSDRIMITGMIGADANGVYSISYKIPMILNTFSVIFNQAWNYSAIKGKGSKDETEYNNAVFKFMVCMVMFFSVIVITLVKPLMCIYVSDKFYIAWQYVPILMIGVVYINLGTFISSSYSAHKDGFGYFFSATFGAALNIILNLIFIPKIGLYGAAVATSISYISVFIFRLFHARKYIVYNINYREFWIGTIVLISVSLACYVDNIYMKIIQNILAIFLMGFYGHIWIPIVKTIVSRFYGAIFRK